MLKYNYYFVIFFKLPRTLSDLGMCNDLKINRRPKYWVVSTSKVLIITCIAKPL